MATAIASTASLSDDQRAWLKKMGAVLDVPVGDSVKGASPGSVSSGGSASGAASDASTASGSPKSVGGLPTGLDPIRPEPQRDEPQPQPQPPQPPAPGSRPLLLRGAKGQAVKDMQGLLKKHGATINDDGDFGPKTETAVKEFQRSKGLKDDGKVGDKTWTALEAASPQPPVPPSPPDTKPRKVVVIVTNEDTNDAIDNAAVVVGEQMELTGNTGQATLSLPPGEHSLGLSAPGFKPKSDIVKVTADEKQPEHRVEMKSDGSSARDKVLVKITISPSGSRMMRQVKQKFTATGFFVDGSEDKNLAVEWESSKPKFLAIDKKTGVAVANIATTVEITAKDPATGVVSKPATITVVDLESIKIIPEKPPSLPAKLQIDFSAVAKFSDGTTDPFAVEWESSAEHIVSIDDQTGRATGNSPGTATIKANAGQANLAIHAEVAITVTQGTPLAGENRDFTGLRRDLQTANPILKRASDAEDAMFFAAALERIDLENPKSAVASRPPSKLSDQDKTNLHTSFAQVDQARVQKAHILHEMQATTRELATATKLQLNLKRPPDQTLTQQQKNDLSTGLKIITTVLDGLSTVVPVFTADKFKLGELVLAIIGTNAVNDRITAIDDELERLKKQVEELGAKLERTINKLETTITALKDAATDQILDLKEKWRVQLGDFAEQSKLYDNALREYQKLVLKVSPKEGAGPGFEKTFAAILTASQASLSARSALNTARLREDAAKRFLAELQNPGTFQKQLKKPDVAIFERRRGEFFNFLGETEASVKDLEEQVQKVNELYKSSAKIDRIFKAWKDALEE